MRWKRGRSATRLAPTTRTTLIGPLVAPGMLLGGATARADQQFPDGRFPPGETEIMVIRERSGYSPSDTVGDDRVEVRVRLGTYEKSVVSYGEPGAFKNVLEVIEGSPPIHRWRQAMLVRALR